MRFLAYLLPLLLLLGPNLGAAQVRITITGGQEKALPVAIVPFKIDSAVAFPKTDIATIVGADLRRSGLFEPLPEKNFVSKPSRSENVRYANWRALGADHLVIGTIGPGNGDNYEVRFELLDVYGGEVLTSKIYTVNRDALRSVAHTISNAIFQELVGRSGGFNSKLVYVQTEGEGEQKSFRLIYADADGNRPQTILRSREPLLSPAWSADRQRLAYVSFENRRPEIYVQEISTGKRRKVASFNGINSAPAFSPDGRKLALTLSRDGNPNIYLLDLDSGETRKITDSYSIDTEPVWTPDGEHIYFTSDRSGGPQIYRISASGGKAERVTFDGNYNASADLSPDGRLLTMVTRDNSGFHIAVMDLEENLTRTLTDGKLDESPSFSPSGAMVVYTRVQNGRTDLATVSVHGRANQSLHQFDGEVREPAWSPL